ncbi:Ubiquitin carboxyl-terminal hydrolase 22 [Takifugu flavidus]|uniref:Ubiquitin carboxyl-terminal hydrolase 22 n=1 Tax=Takifugu flavidus TaxID=433684 RepID=A0A5C6MMD7_9TELE|nr:Ubiquitin carboxyl-terminal hydrolase 22 [Takifugu flavidus]
MSPAGCSHVNGYKVDNWKQNLRVIYQCFVWTGTAETRRRKVEQCFDMLEPRGGSLCQKSGSFADAVKLAGCVCRGDVTKEEIPSPSSAASNMFKPMWQEEERLGQSRWFGRLYSASTRQY